MESAGEIKLYLETEICRQNSKVETPKFRKEVPPPPPNTGTNAQPAPPVKIELHKRSYDELSEVLIEKVLETETLYQKMFDNCKHRSGCCKKGNCKHCDIY